MIKLFNIAGTTYQTTNMMKQTVSYIFRHLFCTDILSTKQGIIFKGPVMSQNLFRTIWTDPSSPALKGQKIMCRNLPWTSKIQVEKTVASKCAYVSRKNYPFSELREEELEEDFVRGSGPGGQSVNQTANCVVLKHKPSGIVVKCHETRSLHQNRERARERLKERLDLHVNGDNSFLALQAKEASLNRKQKKNKNKARLALKKAFKEREGIE